MSSDEEKRGYVENVAHQATRAVVRPIVVAIADGNPVGVAVELVSGVLKTAGSLVGLNRSDDD